MVSRATILRTLSATRSGTCSAGSKRNRDKCRNTGTVCSAGIPRSVLQTNKFNAIYTTSRYERVVRKSRRLRQGRDFAMSSQDFVLKPEDFSVIVKRRDKDPTPWKWEIWAACRNRPAHRS